ncbi:MAG: hypothetical protein M1834_004255 [Cirrosporium novae-zelandiae]|nr:MAG: hypothetical protein M1834_004255 [Cirrosporium novae-zelandiae]
MGSRTNPGGKRLWTDVEHQRLVQIIERNPRASRGKLVELFNKGLQPDQRRSYDGVSQRAKVILNPNSAKKPKAKRKIATQSHTKRQIAPLPPINKTTISTTTQSMASVNLLSHTQLGFGQGAHPPIPSDHQISIPGFTSNTVPVTGDNLEMPYVPQMSASLYPPYYLMLYPSQIPVQEKR